MPFIWLSFVRHKSKTLRIKYYVRPVIRLDNPYESYQTYITYNFK